MRARTQQSKQTADQPSATRAIQAMAPEVSRTPTHALQRVAAREGKSEDVLALSRSLGNGAVQRLLAQRQLPGEEEELQMKVVAHREAAGEGFELDSETTGRISRARGGGRPRDANFGERMGADMGHDFSGVRVHADREAHDLNQALSARAFTTGHDIVFRQGDYSPGSSGGRELIAHELSHVVQQATGRVKGSGSGMTVRPAGDLFEADARTWGRKSATATQPPAAPWGLQLALWPPGTGGTRHERLPIGLAPTISSSIQRTLHGAAQADANRTYNCHAAVADWLERSGVVASATARAALRQEHFGHTNWTAFAHHIFYGNGLDRAPVVKPLGRNIALQPGLIVGFYDAAGDTLTHSMVSLGRGAVAGHNNVGTFGAAGRQQNLNALEWHVDPAGRQGDVRTLAGGWLRVYAAHPGAAAGRLVHMVGG